MADVRFKKLNDNAQTPKHGSKYAAGWDLYAAIDSAVGINPHTTEMIGTGLAMEIPQKTFGAIFARSGLAAKQGLRPANCVGVVDSDYRGEVKVALHNDTDGPQIVSPGDRIAQLVVIPYVSINLIESDELDDTERGEGGFGSTGTN